MPFGSSQWMYNSGADFFNGVATQSLRFDDGSSAYLNRTPSSAGNRKTWTWSGWVKRANILGTSQRIFTAQSGSDYTSLYFHTSETLYFLDNQTTTKCAKQTNAVFRDVSAWYHILIAIDTTQTTASDRYQLYINGEQVTSFNANTDYPLNQDTIINNNSQHDIGRLNSNIQFFDGYMAEVNFVDGQALDPTSFGEFKNGVWIAKEYTDSYGTNGFRLEFNQTGTGTPSSSTIGADTSGNANHFSSSGIVASDCDMPDSPENNWSTMNSLINGYGTNITMSEGNLAGTGTSAQYNNTLGTILMTSGKWYWEISSADFNNYDMLGIAIETAIQTTDSTPYGQTGVIAYATQGAVYNESASGTGSYTSFQASEIIGIAVDLDASPRTFKFYNNNTLQGTINLSSNFDDVGILPFFCIGNTDTIKVNFGQDSSFAGLKTAQGNTDDNDIGDFYYSPPSGYLALCTANLPEPTISPNEDTQADDYFNTKTYSGNSSTQAVTGVGFQPDWVWIKRRNGVADHNVFDSVRGVDKRLETNSTDAEVDPASTQFASFDSDGFTLQNAFTSTNESPNTYVSWNWKAGGTAVSNTDGSITSSVSANTDAGFSIVTYTGDSTGNDGTASTIGHGLGAVPKFIFTLPRDSNDGAVYHADNTSAPETERLILKSTSSGNLATADDAGFWNDTAPTSTVFSVGTRKHTNSNGGMVAYCFAEVEGYSKFGSYTGNGSTDGTFVYTGFRPAWVMVKRTDSANNWVINDTTRATFNEITGGSSTLYADTSNQESDLSTNVDFLSNGFKARTTGGHRNASGTYIYMAFAEVPFKYSLGR